MKNKMPKIAGAVLCMFLLCSCNASRELDEQSLVCTLCFSYKREYTVTLEVLTENTEEKKLLSKTVVSGGDTIEEAINGLKNKMSKKPLFDHCAAIVLSPEMSKKKQREALLYCVREPTVNLGTPVIYSRDQTALLKCRSESAGVGYDIMLTLKELSLEKNSRLYKTAVKIKNIQRFENVNGTLMRIED